ncbi:FtsX-like permease family protein [Blastococcus montanus]|uniref:FtsX-like permease family protein n=1 Tax=Blastococcus montanus TaxID=3144973 RepID=UPI003209CF27
MVRLALGMARRRMAALVAVAFAVLGGVAIVTGTGVLLESGLRSELSAGRLAGADVLVAADPTVPRAEDLDLALPERRPVPAELVHDLANVPGVTAVAGDVSFPAAVLDGDAAVAPVGDAATDGHGWSSVALLPRAAVEGAPPTGADEVALDADLAAAAGLEVGDTARLVAAGVPGEYRVTAVVRPAGAGVLFDDATAAELAGRTDGARAATVDLVGLRVEPGATDRVAAAVRAELPGTGLVVATGDDRGEAVLPGAASSRSLLVVLAGSLAGVPLLVVGFLVAGAVSVSIAGQRPELALLRAVGTTPRQLRRLVAAQATGIGAVAALPGLLLGYLLAGRFRSLLVDIGLLPEALPLTVSPLPAVAAVLLLLLVVQVAARGAAWRVSREPVTTVLGESRTGPRTPSAARTRAGLFLLVAAVPLAVPPLLVRSSLGAASTSMAGIVAAVGLALAGPALLRRVSGGLAARLPARASAPTWLATANLHGYALRSAGAISTLAMAVVFVLTYTFAQTTVTGAVARDVETATLADATVDASAVGGVPDGLLEEVRATEGVRAAAPVSTTTVLLTGRTLGTETVEPSSALVLSPAASDVLDLGVRSGDLIDLTGPTVAIGRELAEARGTTVGDDVALTLGDGTGVEARVVAVYDRTLGFGPVALSPDLAAGHRGSDLADSLLVRTDGTAGASERLAALQPDWPGIAVSGVDAGSGIAQATPPEVWVNLAVIVVLLGYVLLGTTNAMVAGTAQRRTEFATLRLTGTTPRQIRAMVRREAALISAAAVVAGLLLAALPLALLGVGFLARPWPAGPWWLVPATVVVVAVVAFLSTEGPTRLALRTPPAETLGRAG